MVAIVTLVTVGSADAADRMAGDGLGCKDRTIAGRLIDMPDTDPAYIEIWAKGMQDLSCRGQGSRRRHDLRPAAGRPNAGRRSLFLGRQPDCAARMSEARPRCGAIPGKV
jgi:hypothetical protein